ncbi:hypothetical protein [Paraburkholderia sp. J8-2]|uniref:hypothetical protein n=1 Tax=Paraburkholderia sp. J8-2 TaxID=2805440 RepID=UPI002AB7C579|nr:hypothetical protein [Paraburkholderia sp. J8-2]
MATKRSTPLWPDVNGISDSDERGNQSVRRHLSALLVHAAESDDDEDRGKAIGMLRECFAAKQSAVVLQALMDVSATTPEISERVLDLAETASSLRPLDSGHSEARLLATAVFPVSIGGRKGMHEDLPGELGADALARMAEAFEVHPILPGGTEVVISPILRWRADVADLSFCEISQLGEELEARWRGGSPQVAGYTSENLTPGLRYVVIGCVGLDDLSLSSINSAALPPSEKIRAWCAAIREVLCAAIGASSGELDVQVGPVQPIRSGVMSGELLWARQVFELETRRHLGEGAAPPDLSVTVQVCERYGAPAMLEVTYARPQGIPGPVWERTAHFPIPGGADLDLILMMVGEIIGATGVRTVPQLLGHTRELSGAGYLPQDTGGRIH